MLSLSFLMSLWLPILLSAIGVFVVSSLIWMVVQWHNSDWKQLPDEENARHALKGVSAGQYWLPYAADGKARQDPEWLRKAREGPTVMMIVTQGDPTRMGKQLIQWFIYCLVISFLIAAVGAATLPRGAGFALVFHSIVIYAALTYSGGHAMGAIWFGHTWARTIKDIVDGVIYALVTGAIFAWLWPA
jgi:hypothetical protein